MPDAPIEYFVSAPPSAEIQASLQAWRRAPDVQAMAVMPDVHLAHDVCIGTVIATGDALYPAAVGGDIGCGMIALRFDASADAIDGVRADALLRAFGEAIPIIRRRITLPWPDEIDPHPPHTAVDRRMARHQLGTIGRGNHFVEVQADEADALWVLIHTGSRGVGQAVRGHHVLEPRRPLMASSAAGQAYLADFAWARAYAQANRRAVLLSAATAMRQVLGARPDLDSLIECDHNHVQREAHAEGALWVHRKGALHAGEGVPGVIPGSMGTASFHTIGRGCAAGLCSSAHGAGRELSRTEARRRLSVDQFTRTMTGVWFDRGRSRALLSEAPDAYRNIGAVMRAQRDLVRIRRRLRPVLSYKGA